MRNFSFSKYGKIALCACVAPTHMCTTCVRRVIIPPPKILISSFLHQYLADEELCLGLPLCISVYFCIFTARKREGNVFTPVCHSVHSRGYDVTYCLVPCSFQEYHISSCLVPCSFAGLGSLQRGFPFRVNSLQGLLALCHKWPSGTNLLILAFLT